MVNEVSQYKAELEQDDTYDTSDNEAVNKVRKKTARTRADRIKFVDAGMSVAEGRAWFYDFLKRCHVFNQPYVSGDTHATAFRLGEMNVGLMLLDDIQTIAPEQYITMVRENKTKNG